MIAVVVSITCNWCGLPLASTHPHGANAARSTLTLADAPAAAAALEAQVAAGDRGVAIASPDDHPNHLCRACHRRGTPPATNKGHAARQRRARRSAA